MDALLQPWPWYVSGPLIALVMAFLVFFGKTFGMSSNLRTLCSIGGAGKYADFFKFDWKAQKWNLTVVLGAIIGGFIATQFLSDGSAIDLNPETISDLKTLGFEINPYNRCTVNKMINDKQCTICWYVDDNKISHVELEVVIGILK